MPPRRGRLFALAVMTLCCLVLLAPKSSAQGSASLRACGPIGPGQLVTLYINGIANSTEQALGSCRALDAVLRTAGVPLRRVLLFYNRTQSEALTDCESRLREISDGCSQLRDAVEAALQIQNILGGYRNPVAPDARRLAVVIQGLVVNPRPVAIISHSQGNLMLQEAVFAQGSTVPRDRWNSLHWASVAAPVAISSPLFGGFDAIVLDGDPIRTLGNNVAPPADERFWMVLPTLRDHRFATYLDNPDSRARIIAVARGAAASAGEQTTATAPVPESSGRLTLDAHLASLADACQQSQTLGALFSSAIQQIGERLAERSPATHPAQIAQFIGEPRITVRSPEETLVSIPVTGLWLGLPVESLEFWSCPMGCGVNGVAIIVGQDSRLVERTVRSRLRIRRTADSDPEGAMPFDHGMGFRALPNGWTRVECDRST